MEWRIAALCAQLADGDLSRLLADAGVEAILQRILDAIRSGDSAKVTSADLDALEDAAASIGIDGAVDVESRYSTARGAGGWHARRA